MEKRKNATITVDTVKWDRFRRVAKANNSDASKEIRKFVDRYLSENTQLLMEVVSDDRGK